MSDFHPPGDPNYPGRRPKVVLEAGPVLEQIMELNDACFKLADHIRWAAQTTHQAHHGPSDNPLTWRECNRETCAAARIAVADYE